MQLTPNGLMFTFDFHHVAAITIEPVAHYSNFVTRDIKLTDEHGKEITLNIFSKNDARDIPVHLKEIEIEEVEEVVE